MSLIITHLEDSVKHIFPTGVLESWVKGKEWQISQLESKRQLASAARVFVGTSK